MSNYGYNFTKAITLRFEEKLNNRLAYFVISSISFSVIWQLFSTAVMGMNSA